jgi:MoxR-like ATPase
VLDIQESVKHVHIDRTIGDYIVRLTHQTRSDGRLRVGLSPRGSLALYRTSQARAWLAGRAFVLPEDVRALAVPVLAHRLILDTKARYGGAQSSDVIKELLESVAVPR